MILRQAFEQREVAALNDPALLEWLGIEPGKVNVRGKNALKEVTVYTCIKILTEFLGKLPPKIYQETEGTRKASDHYLYNTLKLRPNPYMTTTDFFKALESQRNIHGNAYANIEFHQRGPLAGRVKALWPIDSAKVRVYIDQDTVGDSEPRIWYVVNVSGEERKVKSHEMIHVKGVTLDGIIGLSPIEYLRATIENAKSGTDYINRFYKAGMQTKGIVHYVGDLSEQAKKTFRERFEEMSSGLDNAHRISLLPVGYQFQPISLKLTDAQFLENTELTLRQIAAAFGVKMHQLNDLSRATHTNIEQQQRQFYADTGHSIVTAYEQEMTFKLFLTSELEAGYYLKFNVDAVIRSDIKTRYEAYRQGVQGGFLLINEARAKEELPPVEGGDLPIVNGNVLPLTMAGAAYQRNQKE